MRAGCQPLERRRSLPATAPRESRSPLPTQHLIGEAGGPPPAPHLGAQERRPAVNPGALTCSGSRVAYPVLAAVLARAALRADALVRIGGLDARPSVAWVRDEILAIPSASKQQRGYVSSGCSAAAPI